MSDCELPQYYRTQERMARKAHACCECSAPIGQGEKYLEVRACWENRPDTYRQHILCEQACEYVRDEGLNDDDCLYYGGLQEWYREWIKGGFGNIDADKIDRSMMWRFILRIKQRERKSRPPKEIARI